MGTVTCKSADCANCARPSQRQLSHGHMFNHDGIHLKLFGLRAGETATCNTSMRCEADDQSASQAQNDNTFIGADVGAVTQLLALIRVSSGSPLGGALTLGAVSVMV
jgi:hypothetical protein